MATSNIMAGAGSAATKNVRRQDSSAASEPGNEAWVDSTTPTSCPAIIMPSPPPVAAATTNTELASWRLGPRNSSAIRV